MDRWEFMYIYKATCTPDRNHSLEQADGGTATADRQMETAQVTRPTELMIYPLGSHEQISYV